MSLISRVSRTYVRGQALSDCAFSHSLLRAKCSPFLVRRCSGESAVKKPWAGLAPLDGGEQFARASCHQRLGAQDPNAHFCTTGCERPTEGSTRTARQKRNSRTRQYTHEASTRRQLLPHTTASTRHTASPLASQSGFTGSLEDIGSSCGVKSHKESISYAQSRSSPSFPET